MTHTDPMVVKIGESAENQTNTSVGSTTFPVAIMGPVRVRHGGYR